MDILDTLFYDLRAINSHIQAQDVQLANALKGFSKGKAKPKNKLMKSRGALPSFPPQRMMSKSKLKSKASLKKIGNAKSKGLINIKSSKILVKRKPKTQQTTARLLPQKSAVLKQQRKEPIPSAAARPAPKRSFVPSTNNLQASSLTPAPPATKKPPTLTDGSLPVHKFRAEFRQHLQEIEKMKDLLTDSPEETEILKEMNGVVSVLLKKSQSYLSKADYSLRNANAEAPNHYKDILRKLLDNQSKTTIVMSPKPASRKIPIYKKMQIEYTDRNQKDLNDLLEKHPRIVGFAETTSTKQASPRNEFNFPDIFDRVYAKPQILKESKKEFDLSSFSSAKLIERAQQSLSSAISSESISNFKRESSGSMSPAKYIAQDSSKVPQRAEVELDALVNDVIQKASRNNSTRKLPELLEPEDGRAPSTSINSPLVISTHNLSDSSRAPALIGSAIDSSVPDSSFFTPTPTKFPSPFPSIDEDLAMLTPSLFTRKPQENQDYEEVQEDKQMAFEMDLIRSSNQNERERIHGQMNEMRSRLDSLLDLSPSSAAQCSSDVGIELFQYNLQVQGNDKKLGEHEELLHKVLNALAKKTSQDEKDASSGSKDKSEWKLSRTASKLVSMLPGECNFDENDNDEAALESKSDDTSGRKSHLTPAPPAQRSTATNQTPRSRKLAKAISLSTMHEEEGENDDDSERTGSSSKKENHSKKVYGSSRPTEKSLAAIEATKERSKNYDSTRPTEVDMKF